MRRKILRLTLVFCIGLVVMPLGFWSCNLARRPPRVEVAYPLFQGISYQRYVLTTPRPNLAHVVQIDLTAPGIRLVVTPGNASRGREILAATTSEFLAQTQAQVAINGGFFGPFVGGEYTLNSYYPHSGDPVEVKGLTIANGAIYSTWEPLYPTLCLTTTQAVITRQVCPADTLQAISGNRVLLENGAVVLRANDPDVHRHPRTAVALDATGQMLWLVVVDGRQADYSDGMTLDELTAFWLELGVDTALNLDGGGSSALVMAGPLGPQLLNAPIHTRFPIRERPVANHLGVYALPLGASGP